MILIKLLLAHLVGDFLFQPGKWVKDKEAKKLRSPYLYYHVLIHAALPFILLGKISYWWAALLIGGMHFIIDVFKLYFQQETSRRQWFLMDQLLHLLVVIAVWYLIAKPSFEIKSLLSLNFYIIVTALYFIIHPASILIKMIISQWEPTVNDGSGEITGEEETSLQNAGKYIGMLERLFVFTFIFLNQWQAIGFLIAAKSVFRFGDLKDSDGRKLTEYVLIGTLLSFGMAIVTGLLVRHFMQTG